MAWILLVAEVVQGHLVTVRALTGIYGSRPGDPQDLFSFPTTQFLSLVEPELRFWFTQTIQFISGYWSSREIGISLIIK